MKFVIRLTCFHFLLVSCSFSLRYPPPVPGTGDCGHSTPHAPRQKLVYFSIKGDGHSAAHGDCIMSCI